MARQAARQSAGDRYRPQVAFGREDDRFTANVGRAVEARACQWLASGRATALLSASSARARSGALHEGSEGRGQGRGDGLRYGLRPRGQQWAADRSLATAGISGRLRPRLIAPFAPFAPSAPWEPRPDHFSSPRTRPIQPPQGVRPTLRPVRLRFTREEAADDRGI